MPNRSNTVSDDDESWYVYDEQRDRLVYGPFGSEEYAETVRDRAEDWPWPENLSVGKKEAV